jgi:hypothetical protein
MRTCSETTKADLAALGWFPHSPPTPAWAVAAFWDAMHERPMSRKREDRMRQALGMEALPVIEEVPVCPIHGVVHDAGPCAEDKPIAAVVALAPGETVRRPAKAKRRPPVRRPWMGAELTAAMDAAGMTDEDVRQIVAQALAGRAPGMEGKV